MDVSHHVNAVQRAVGGRTLDAGEADLARVEHAVLLAVDERPDLAQDVLRQARLFEHRRHLIAADEAILGRHLCKDAVEFVLVRRAHRPRHVARRRKDARARSRKPEGDDHPASRAGARRERRAAVLLRAVGDLLRVVRRVQGRR